MIIAMLIVVRIFLLMTILSNAENVTLLAILALEKSITIVFHVQVFIITLQHYIYV